MLRMFGLVALAGIAVPATAAVTVIGSNSARLCYEAARSQRTSASAIARCDAAFDEALSADDEVATHVNRGILRAMRGDKDGAARDYDAGIALDPDQPEAWLNKGLLFLRNGEAAAAVPLFDAALNKRTREPGMAHYGRAVAHEQAGNLRAAYADYRRATELSPDWEAPRAELARFKVRGTR